MSKCRIKDIISELRQANLKPTQAGMAEAAGVPQSYISRIINNQTKAIDPNILFAIANYLTEVSGQRFTIANLFDGTDAEKFKSSAHSPDQPPPDERQDNEVLRAIEHLENRMDKGFAEVSQQIADLRKEVGKSN